MPEGALRRAGLVESDDHVADARAGHSVAVLLAIYTPCIDGKDQITNRQIDHALHSATRRQTRQPAVPRTAGPTPILSAICP
jgi:hypothetical protein